MTKLYFSPNSLVGVAHLHGPSTVVGPDETMDVLPGETQAIVHEFDIRLTPFLILERPDGTRKFLHKFAAIDRTADEIVERLEAGESLKDWLYTEAKK